MRTMWKGAISFGLVHIPIKLFTATEDKDIKLNNLHDKCKSRLNYEKRCPVCQEVVKSEEIVKGYEYEGGKYVVLKDEDFEKIPLESSKAISIINFVNLTEVDPIYFEKSYFVAPGEGGQKPYELLRVALEKSKKVAISKVVLRNKESLAVLRIYQNGILMETMHYPDEIRTSSGISELNYQVNLNDNELSMAETLINSLTEPFSPEKYHDNYRDALMEVVQSKIAGKEVEIPARPDERVVDLVEALKASIQKVQEDKKPEEKPKKEKGKKKVEV